jgi:hypothetical protein
LSTTDHGAAASALGYLYQVDWALLELLRNGKHRPDFGVTLEKDDDVSWEEAGTPTELLQLKHHAPGAPSLTDKSDDWWRSVKVWMDSRSLLDSAGPMLCIVTTAAAGTGSAMALLRPGATHDSVEALKLIDAAATESMNENTKAARKAWLELPTQDRIGLLERVRILDSSSRDVAAAIREELYFTLPTEPALQEAFEHELFGWWHSVALDILNNARGPITPVQVRAHVERLSDRYRPGALPTTDPISDDAVSAVIAEHTDRMFVQQMRWIGSHDRQVEKAIVNFHRQVTQTTDWLDRDLIEMREFDAFKRELADEWEWRFLDMCDDLGDAATEGEKRAAGRKLFADLRQNVSAHIRATYTETFYGHGVQLEIADDGHRGWHQDFERMITAIAAGVA